MLTIHHHLHIDPEVLALLRKLVGLETSIMATVADLKTQADKTLAAVTKETDIDNAIVLLVQGNTAQITALKQQVADLIASGADPTVLQPILDSLVTAESTSLANGQLVADAVTAGTSV